MRLIREYFIKSAILLPLIPVFDGIHTHLFGDDLECRYSWGNNPVLTAEIDITTANALCQPVGRES